MGVRDEQLLDVSVQTVEDEDRTPNCQYIIHIIIKEVCYLIILGGNEYYNEEQWKNLFEFKTRNTAPDEMIRAIKVNSGMNVAVELYAVPIFRALYHAFEEICNE